MPLRTNEATYDAIQPINFNLDYDDIQLVASDPFSLPSWLGSPPPSFDYLLNNFPLDESIIEVMSLEELPWKYHHHQSSFLPYLTTFETHIKSRISPNVVDNQQTPILTKNVLSEGNLGKHFLNYVH